MSILDQIRKQKWPVTGAVIVAAGEGKRMEGIDKQFVELRGRPALAWTIAAFQETLCISEIVVVARSEQLGQVHVLKEKYGFDANAIVSMEDVTEHLYNKPYKGKVYIDDALKKAIDEYYAVYGA